ncbi:CLUMA_CG003766, isoform A [Clunio marinus]|uniref:CLUMA_CG003766, isoform A n=1 Tax=Clunio marinus TaxID=568069 RepID=A0A1J1HV57_9DIPT|nr:CLUMA_CG003766, isoform A [Clunio marinus]
MMSGLNANRIKHEKVLNEIDCLKVMSLLFPASPESLINLTIPISIAVLIFDTLHAHPNQTHMPQIENINSYEIEKKCISNMELIATAPKRSRDHLITSHNNV